MSNMIINKSNKGRLFLCSICNAIHLEFGNISLKFTWEDFMDFTKTIKDIDIENLKNNRFTIDDMGRIFFITPMAEIALIFDIEEIKELKYLLLHKEILNRIKTVQMKKKHEDELLYWNSLKKNIRKN